MLVYRIETGPFGKGPYTFNWSHRWELCATHNNLNHPSPREDPSLGWPDLNEYCGLDSPVALLKWFESKWRKLMEGSFIVSVYEADGARVGINGQVLFSIFSAEYVTSYRISEFVAECKQLAKKS